MAAIRQKKPKYSRGHFRNRRGERALPQSPELAGGAGFTFENLVGANYLVSLLSEAYAPGIENQAVCRVSLQQRDFGEPLDDVIVDFRDTSGVESRLSLQAKRKLVISAAESNTDFRDIIRDSWGTLTKQGFRVNRDRYGAAVGEIAADKARAIRSLCEFARESLTVDHFEQRFTPEGNANALVRSIKSDISGILAGALGTCPSGEQVRSLLAHFVLIEFDFLHEGSIDPPEVLTRLRDCLATDHHSQAPLAWSQLCELSRTSAGRAGQFDRSRLVLKLAPILRLQAAPSLRNDLRKITDISRAAIDDIRNDVGGKTLLRNSLLLALNAAMSESRVVCITGLPGTGKSALLRHLVEAELQNGPVLFLKCDRLEGRGWAGFSNASGLSTSSLIDLLSVSLR
jgi:hypothetical protein